MNESNGISVIMIAQDEEERIAATLASVHAWVDEIIVVDGGSRDRTVEIAKQFTDQVHVMDWPGYGVQKQRALNLAKCPWVLALDADEIVTPALKEEILSIVNNREKPFSGYRIPVVFMFLGYALEYCKDGNPLRLFEREQTRYSNAAVHEGAIVKNNRVSILKNHLLHDSILSLDVFIEKRNRYAQYWAEQEFAKGRKSSLVSAFSHAVWCFFKMLILRGGILNGGYAVILASVYAQYTFNKFLLLKYLHLAAKQKHGRLDAATTIQALPNEDSVNRQR